MLKKFMYLMLAICSSAIMAGCVVEGTVTTAHPRVRAEIVVIRPHWWHTHPHWREHYFKKYPHHRHHEHNWNRHDYKDDGHRGQGRGRREQDPRFTPFNHN